MKATGVFMLAVLLLVPTVVRGNDGFGGLTATGLQFQQSRSVRMVSEDLFLSPDRVRVRYVFRNEGPEPVSGEVIFPLPPISLAPLMGEMMFSLPPEQLAGENLVNMTATVDGRPIGVAIDRIAVLEPPNEEERAPRAGYESPGEDVSALLKELGIPLSLDVQQVATALNRLPKASRDRLRDKGLVEWLGEDPPLPLWSIVVRYHWPQTFAVGRDVVIEHSYDPAPPGGIFVWPEQDKDLDPYQRELVRTYCIDTATRKALARRLHGRKAGDLPGTGTAILLDYVLTTANTWHGPIGSFRLTIDKGRPDNILSLCIDGIRKTGPTTFVVEKKEFTPRQDLRILIVSGLEQTR